MAGCEYIIGNKRYTEQELKDFLLKGGLKSFLEDKSIDLSKIKGSNKPPAQPPSEVNVLMQEPNRNKREFGVKKHLMEAKGIPEHFKQGIEKSGLFYEVSNPQQAQDAARGIVDTMGRDNALRLASEGSIDPSVGSAIFTESLNDIWSEERESKNNGDTQKEYELAREFIAAQDELARISNSGGKWNAQLAHSYKTSPMAFVMRTNSERAEQFKNWLSENTKESDLKQVHEEFLKSEEGKLLISEKVEELRKEERKAERESRKERVHKLIDESIDKWADKLSAKLPKGTEIQGFGNIKDVLKIAGEGIKKAYDTGENVISAINDAIEQISKAIGTNDWDKDSYRDEMLGKLVAKGGVEKTDEQLLNDRIKQLESQIKDYEDRISKGGEFKPKSESKFNENEDIIRLQEERNTLRKENDQLLRNKKEGKYSDAAKLELDIKRKEARIAELTRKINEKDFSQAAKKEKGQETELDKKINELKEEYNKLKKENVASDAKVPEKEKLTRLEKAKKKVIDSIADIREKILAKEAEKHKENKPLNEDLELNRLKEQESYLKDLRDKYIPKEKDPFEFNKKRERLKDKLINDIVDLNEQINAGEKTKKESPQLFDDAEINRLRQEKEKRQQILEDIDPSASEEARVKQAIKSAEKSLEEYNRRIEEEDFSKKETKALIETPELKDIRDKRNAAKKEYDDLMKAKKEGKYSDAAKLETALKNAAKLETEYKRRVAESDYKSEAYKNKKEIEQKLKDAIKLKEQAKEAYDEAKKESPEYQEKKAKQYLDRFRERLGKLDDEQKDALIRMSIKDLIKNKALSYDDFKQNIAKVIGIKELSESEITHIEELTADINAAEVAENKMIDNPTDANIKAYEEAKRKGQLSNQEIHNITHKEADITGVTKSWMTGSFLSLFSGIKNPLQNVIYQSTIRFPKALVKKGLDYGLAATGLDKHTTDLTLGNKWYWKEARKGLLKSIHNFKAGTQEQDITSKYTYRSTLAPIEAAKDIKLWKAGNKFLTKQEVVERYIRKSIFARQSDVILRLMAVGDIPQRHAAEGAAAVQIGFKELGIIEDNVMESFILSPKKMAYKILRAEGKTEVQAESLSKEIGERIIREGEKAVFQESNWTSEVNDWLEKSLKVNKENGIAKKIAKTTGSIAKTLTFPFIKIPANIAWQTFKAINPEISMMQASVQLGLANYAYRKGDMATYRKIMSEAKDSIAHAIVGGGLSMAASYLITNGYVRPSNNSNTKRKESEGEKAFGKQNQINFGRMMGGSDYWVDFSWFGIFGATIDTYAQLQQDKIDRARKGEPERSNIGYILDKFQYSAKAGLNQLVFDQGAKTLDALQSGGSKLQTLGVNTFNNLANMTTGATLTAISKATLKEQARLKGEDIVEEIGNNQKQRNILLRTAMNLYKTDSGEPPARISIWGDPITNDRSFAGIAGTLLGGEKGNADKFALQIYIDATKTGNIDFYPSVAQDKLKVNDEEVKLTPKEQDNLSIYIGRKRKMLVDALISGNSSYGSYQDIPLEKRLDALKDTYKVAREIGTTQFKEAFPQFKNAKVSPGDKLREAREKSKSDRRQFEFKRILKNQ